MVNNHNDIVIMGGSLVWLKECFMALKRAVGINGSTNQWEKIKYMLLKRQ